MVILKMNFVRAMLGRFEKITKKASNAEYSRTATYLWIFDKLSKHRLTILGTSGFKCHRTGQRRRKSVRGCIVGRDLGTIACVVVDKGGNEKVGLTDVTKPRRLGPKRANNIRKFFGLPRHWDLKNKKTDNKSKVEVERFDVTRYIVKRPSKNVDGKSYYKVTRDYLFLCS
jgi:ribosomal protein S6E (S10)